MAASNIYTTPESYQQALNLWSVPGAQNPNSTNYNPNRGPMPIYQQPVPTTTPAPTPKPVTTPTTTTATGPKPKTPYELAVEAARTRATSAFNANYARQGLSGTDSYGLNAEFTRLLNNAIQSLPANATTSNINNLINYDNLWSTALNNQTTGQTNQLTNALNAARPAGGQWYADTADDALLQEILGTQYNDTNTSLQNMLNAGQITQAQYDAAIGQLGYDPTGQNYTGQSATAYNTLQGLGGGVLSGMNTELNTILNNFSTAVGGYTLGGNVNPSDYTTQIANAQTGNTGSMRGDILSALGNTHLYDVNTLIQNSNAPQSNAPLPGSNPQGTGGTGIPSTSIPNSGQQGGAGTGQPQVALNEEDDRRGVGTTGTF